MLKRLIQPHSIIITVLIFLFIWLLNFLQLNMHYLDPFNNGLKDYEITDIVYSYLFEHPSEDMSQIVLVNSGQPDRVRIAQLVDKLSAAGAGVIGLDILFEKRLNTTIDSNLQQSIKNAGNVILACELQDSDGMYDKFDKIVGIHPYFEEAGDIGFVNFPANGTKTIRIFSPQEKVNQDTAFSFATAIVQKFKPEAAHKLFERNRPVEYIHFVANKSDFVRYEQDRLIDSMSTEELRSVVENKVILVGYVAEDIWANPLTDRHYTPLNKNYVGKSIPDMYGVVIHANVINMVLKSQYIKTVPKWFANLLSVIFCYLNVLIIHWIYFNFHEAFHGITRALQIIEFILLFFIIALLFYHFRLKLEFRLGILALLLAYDIIMIYESLIKRRIPLFNRIPNHINFKLLTIKKRQTIDDIEKTNEQNTTDQ